MGQIVHVFGRKFFIASDELDAYIEKRNNIVHNFWRFTSLPSHSGLIGDSKQFLWTFIQETQGWQTVVMGLLMELRQAAAQKEGREDELDITESELKHIQEFHTFLESQIRKGNL